LEEPNSVRLRTEALGDVVHSGVHLEPSSDTARLRSGALFDELFHLSDGRDLGHELWGKAEGPGQVGRRVGIDDDHSSPLLYVGVGQKAGDGGLAHAAFSGDCYLGHDASYDCARPGCVRQGSEHTVK
jgi:hypothetical protein